MLKFCESNSSQRAPSSIQLWSKQREKQNWRRYNHVRNNSFVECFSFQSPRYHGAMRSRVPNFSSLTTNKSNPIDSYRKHLYTSSRDTCFLLMKRSKCKEITRIARIRRENKVVFRPGNHWGFLKIQFGVEDTKERKWKKDKSRKAVSALLLLIHFLVVSNDLHTQKSKKMKRRGHRSQRRWFSRGLVLPSPLAPPNLPFLFSFSIDGSHTDPTPWR